MRRRSSPGEILLFEFLEPLDLSFEDLAELLEVDVSVVDGLISGRLSITDSLASKLGKLFTTSSELWINLQKNYKKGDEKI